MIEKLTSELNRINQGCKTEDIDSGTICGEDEELCPICQKHKETLKKVSTMWADDELKKQETKEWEDGFYEGDWTCDTITDLTEEEQEFIKEMTSFLPRHMYFYDWNLPYAEEIVLILRRIRNKKLQEIKSLMEKA